MRYLIVLCLLCVWSTTAVAEKKPSLDALGAKLADPKPEVRREALRKIAAHPGKDPKQLDLLEKGLADADAENRKLALGGLALRRTGQEPRWVDVRLKMLADVDAGVRKIAAAQLDPSTATTHAKLMAAYKAEKELAVKNALLAGLANGRAPGIVDVMLPLIEDKDVSTRAEVIARIGYIKDPRVVPALIAAAKRGVYGTLNALGATDDPRATALFLELLGSSTVRDQQIEVVSALGRMPDERAVPRLIALWTALPKKGKAKDELAVAIGDTLAVIAINHQAPCDARAKGTAQQKKFLKKVLPKECAAGPDDLD
jgi:HEAT repeat protein